MESYILAIDQGTTGSTALVLNSQGAILSKANQEYPQIYPQPGWVEHNPEEIWKSVLGSVGRALSDARVKPNQIACIGITNQRETTLVWEKSSGDPIYNAIVWQDRRTAKTCASLKKRKLESQFRSKTGLLLDPYFSGTKIAWILDNVPHARSRARSGNLAFGTIDTYLLWRLTAGDEHATDVTNASRTLLMDLKKLQWDKDLCKILGVEQSLLPRIQPSIGLFGRTKGVPGLPDGIPITGIAGDQQSALFGQACFSPGEAKCTYGTGSFLLMNIGPKPVASRSGCLTTVAWQWGSKVVYALEGSAFICGAAVQFLRDGLKMIDKSSQIEDLALQVADTQGVQFVPALTGLGAPHWDPHARGVISGLTRGTTVAHLARATLEGMALQNVELLLAMQKDTKKKLKTLKVDGGAAANNLLMQIQSDYLGVDCVRPKVVETTAAGAAFMAGLGSGLWKSYDDIKAIWQEDRTFSSEISVGARTERLKRWSFAVNQARIHPE
ncbi:MAG: glycerol kinase GlpK [Oligoflexia bacterium]|nr:glycerol kinase GlpK [Oligoflexia bacterium]